MLSGSISNPFRAPSALVPSSRPLLLLSLLFACPSLLPAHSRTHTLEREGGRKEECQTQSFSPSSLFFPFPPSVEILTKSENMFHHSFYFDKSHPSSSSFLLSSFTSLWSPSSLQSQFSSPSPPLFFLLVAASQPFSDRMASYTVREREGKGRNRD